MTVVSTSLNVQLEVLTGIYGNMGRFERMILKCDAEVDSTTFKSASGSPKVADAYIDFSPPEASDSTHIVTALEVFWNNGRAVLMGGIVGKLEILYSMLLFKNLSVQGWFRCAALLE